MTRLITDGAEFGDATFFELGGGSAATNPKRSGSYGYVISPFSASVKLISPKISDFYFRFGSRFDYVGSTIIWLCGFNDGNGSDHAVRVALDTDSHLNFYVGESVVATGTMPYTNGTWHLLDMHIQIAASGVLELKMDGILDLYYSGDTRGYSHTEIDRFWFGSGGYLGFYPNTYVDDIALNDVNGTEDNFWCGDGHVELLIPNNNGYLNEWVGSDEDSVNNYQLVDEIPPDGDTTYVGTVMSNRTEAYGLADYDDSGKIVRRIFAEVRAKDMSAVGQTLKLGFRLNGTNYLCDADRVLSYNYARVAGDQALVNPETNEPWTKADLDNLEFLMVNGIIY